MSFENLERILKYGQLVCYVYSSNSGSGIIVWMLFFSFMLAGISLTTL